MVSCGDVDGDQVIDCTNMLSANEPTWVGAGYDSSGSLSSDPDNYGHWRMQNGSSSEGEFHWRVSRPGSDYASNRHDRLWWGWFTPFDNCDDPGHGLKYGTLDSAVSGMYGNNFCKIRVRSFDFISMHLVTHAWGEMAAGDQIRIETESEVLWNTSTTLRIVFLTTRRVDSVSVEYVRNSSQR